MNAFLHRWWRYILFSEDSFNESHVHHAQSHALPQIRWRMWQTAHFCPWNSLVGHHPHAERHCHPPKDTSGCKKYLKICMWNVHLHHLHVKFEVHEDASPAMRVNSWGPQMCAHNSQWRCSVHSTGRPQKKQIAMDATSSSQDSLLLSHLAKHIQWHRYVQYTWLQLSICCKYRWKELCMWLWTH